MSGISKIMNGYVKSSKFPACNGVVNLDMEDVVASCTAQGQTLVSCTLPNHWNLFVSFSLLIILVIL